MIKANYEAKNYIYILSTTDEYEYIIALADTQQEMADFLGVHFTAICQVFNRHARNENIKYFKGHKLERVKIYEYVYVIYEQELTSPLYVSRDLNNLAKMSEFSKTMLTASLYNYDNHNRKRKQHSPQVHKVKGKYFCKQIDLLDLDTNLARYLESCIDKGKITTSFEDFNDMEDINVKKEN